MKRMCTGHVLVFTIGERAVLANDPAAHIVTKCCVCGGKVEADKEDIQRGRNGRMFVKPVNAALYRGHHERGIQHH